MRQCHHVAKVWIILSSCSGLKSLPAAKCTCFPQCKSSLPAIIWSLNIVPSHSLLRSLTSENRQCSWVYIKRAISDSLPWHNNDLAKKEQLTRPLLTKHQKGEKVSEGLSFTSSCTFNKTWAHVQTAALQVTDTERNSPQSNGVADRASLLQYPMPPHTPRFHVRHAKIFNIPWSTWQNNWKEA